MSAVVLVRDWLAFEGKVSLLKYSDSKLATSNQQRSAIKLCDLDSILLVKSCGAQKYIAWFSEVASLSEMYMYSSRATLCPLEGHMYVSCTSNMFTRPWYASLCPL